MVRRMWSLLILACALPHARPTLEAAYRFSVGDAAIAEPGEQRFDLVALVPDAAGTVRLVTWTDWDGYAAALGGPLALEREVWTTAEGALQAACREDRGSLDDRRLRLAQRLGLPPATAKGTIAVLRAPASAVFRPCPDPETNDQTCALRFPDGVDPAHVAWFNDLARRSYGAAGYPWTRLGYTEDWSGAGRGLSEFVIRAGSTVTVEAVAPVATYCGWP